MEINFNDFFREELTIEDIQVAIENGEVTSKELVMYYLSRIAKYDQDGRKINSVLEINPDAIFIADADRAFLERAGPNRVDVPDV